MFEQEGQSLKQNLMMKQNVPIVHTTCNRKNLCNLEHCVSTCMTFDFCIPGAINSLLPINAISCCLKAPVSLPVIARLLRQLLAVSYQSLYVSLFSSDNSLVPPCNYCALVLRLLYPTLSPLYLEPLSQRSSSYASQSLSLHQLHLLRNQHSLHTGPHPTYYTYNLRPPFPFFNNKSL